VKRATRQDFAAKRFRIAKMCVELKPGRHRRKRLVRACLFVGMLALRLPTAR